MAFNSPLYFVYFSRLTVSIWWFVLNTYLLSVKIFTYVLFILPWGSEQGFSIVTV